MQHLQQHRAPSTVNQYTYRLRKVLSMPQVQQQLAQGAAQQLLGVITQRQQAAGAAAGTPAQPTASAGPGRGRRRSSAAAKPSQEPQAHPAPHHQGDQHMDDAPAHHMHDAPDQHMHDAADTAEHGGLGNRLVSADVAATKHSPAQPKALASAADGQRLLDPAGTTAAAAEAEAAAAAAAAAAAHNASATAVMRAEESLPDHFAPLQPSRDQKRRFYSLMNQLARLTPGDIRLDKFWCDKDWLDVCMQLDLSEPQHMAAAQTALQSMLDNITAAPTTAAPADNTAAPAAADVKADVTAGPAGSGTSPAASVAPAAAAAAQAQAELIAAECRVRKSADVLDVSFAQQMQLRDLVQQLLQLEPSSLRVQLFLAEYEWLVSLLPGLQELVEQQQQQQQQQQQPGSAEPAHKQEQQPAPEAAAAAAVPGQPAQLQVARGILLTLLAESGIAAVGHTPSNHAQQLVSTARQFHSMVLQLRPSAEQLLSMWERVCLQELLGLPADDARVDVLLADCAALQDLLQEPKQINRKARREILDIFVKPRIPADASSAHRDVVRELCAAEACLRPLVGPLQPSILDKLVLLDLTRTLAGLEPSSLKLLRFRVDVKRLKWLLHDQEQALSLDHQQLAKATWRGLLLNVNTGDQALALPEATQQLAAESRAVDSCAQLQQGLSHRLRLTGLIDLLRNRSAAGAVRAAVFDVDSQWLEDLSSQSGGAQEQQQQQQYAQAALRRLLVNDPCLAATASSPEHITQLLQAGWHVWHTCKVLPAGQVPLPQLRRLWTLLRVLLRLPPDDIRVTRFLVNCKRVHRVCADTSLTAEDTQDAVEVLLSNIPSTARAAITDPLSAALVQATLAAFDHLRELFLLLQSNQKQQQQQQQQLEEAFGRLGGPKVDGVKLAQFWLDYEWLLDVLEDPDMTDVDVQAAFTTLLSKTATASAPATAAAATGAGAAGAAVPDARELQQLLVVERHIREMFVQLQPSREDKLLLRTLMQQLAVLPAGDHRVQRLLTDFKALQRVVQDHAMLPADAQERFQCLLKNAAQ